MFRWRRHSIALSALVLAKLIGSTSALHAVDFGDEIEPILQTHCHHCHGPDDANGQLRLDRLANMLRGGNSGEPAIVPGDPDGSFLMKLITHQEAGLEMPPDDALSPDEIRLIEMWIAEGAKTPDHYGPPTETVSLEHWSFRPVKRPSSANSIDGFVHTRLASVGLEPSPPSDRRVLIRRLFLVMHGLPPTPEQVDDFVNDQSPDAWQGLVDEVLASDRYGERWASHWLDIVRFAETNGFETNRERPTAWRYRDWVIDSLNADKPYDEFVRQQIAGDALDEPIGTGFLVAGPMDLVKGKDPKLTQMQRQNELDDIINTCGTAFLGLTTGCARCHNHKFDPITQKDYYAMQAVFAGVQHGEATLPLSEQTQRRIEAIKLEANQIRQRLAKYLSTNADMSNKKPNQSATLRDRVTAKHNVESFAPREAKFVRFTIEATNAGEPCIDELEIYSGDNNVALASLGAKATSSGDFQHPKHKLPHINDGKYGNSHSWIASTRTGGWIQIELPELTLIDRIEWARDRNGEFADRVATQYRIEWASEPSQWHLVASSADRLPPEKLLPDSKSQPARYVFTSIPVDEAEQGRAWLSRLNQIEAEQKRIQQRPRAWIGTFRQPGATYRLYRGEPDAKRERVSPDAIDAFTSLDLEQDAPERLRRLAFANWIAAKENPLTARVIVNRLWQFHFGIGIVDTPSDFGRNGTPPSHPELLDWLACELVDNGWSLKHIHRLILGSATWQRSSRPTPAGTKVDANTRMLWRFPSRRLEAEAIRDSVLAVSGVLDLATLGGPGFSAFEVQLENVRHYHPKQEYGPSDWRRMIYMTKVRQEKDHVFGAFDCPDASMVMPKRSRSTTPQQALNLLNSRFVMQQAEILAKRIQSEAKTERKQVIRAWQLCFQRSPSEQEIADSERFIEQEGMVQFTRAILNANEFVFIP
ncbi:secreted protein containing DUF1549 [Rhodopirellula maiorica SM1]|uniref:Secreted protein containing DUF1549 n=1 Tax=Rhodopirellula maiorica SM1 TaxID=1265738 RepID=M5RI47_9BACT|nr:DUF1553 domain-containing protein [Rhodopirellula maiorica]EMI18851.1 secreted protein containing DUF1549 [Rhodopirellula maiorica SM1]